MNEIFKVNSKPPTPGQYVFRIRRKLVSAYLFFKHRGLYHTRHLPQKSVPCWIHSQIVLHGWCPYDHIPLIQYQNADHEMGYTGAEIVASGG